MAGLLFVLSPEIANLPPNRFRQIATRSDSSPFSAAANWWFALSFWPFSVPRSQFRRWAFTAEVAAGTLIENEIHFQLEEECSRRKLVFGFSF
jgi:hypothetical protein